MASQQLSSTLQAELVCPICIDILKKPVTIDCGHNFCFTCISQIGEASDKFLKCPLCQHSVKRTTFSHNWLLASLVEKIQAVDPPEIQPEVEEGKCQRHGERFHYFCEHDGEFLCVVCRESKDHKFHTTSLIEEAAQKYQGQIQSHVQVLLQKEKDIVQEKTGGEQKIDVFMAQVEFERRRILMEFKHLRRELEEEENFLLSRLCWLGHEVAKGRKFYTSFTEVQLKFLRVLIGSLKAKQQMPSRQMLRDIKGILCRSEGFRFFNPTPVPVELEKKFSESKSSHDTVTDSLKKFKDKFQADRKNDKSRFLKGMDEKDMKSWCLLEKNNPNSSSLAAPSALLQARTRASYVDVPRDRTRSADARGTEDVQAALTGGTLEVALDFPDVTLFQDLRRCLEAWFKW
ncbi:E3 ubiquitin-protein ligase TRIM31-like isoform X3 [Castor canadensis]|uniref:E3 ubiquitin-protein ligase TRIM31-like isoform X3 n=1 Tax=Castor canadensis TaxID=51338 RepID=A0AC58NAU7_CASCN